jgi:hypothetical protein
MDRAGNQLKKEIRGLWCTFVTHEFQDSAVESNRNLLQTSRRKGGVWVKYVTHELQDGGVLLNRNLLQTTRRKGGVWVKYVTHELQDGGVWWNRNLLQTTRRNRSVWVKYVTQWIARWCSLVEKEPITNYSKTRRRVSQICYSVNCKMVESGWIRTFYKLLEEMEACE